MSWAVRLALLLCTAGCGASAVAPETGGATRDESPLRFDAAAPVVALASDGAFAVRRGEGIEVHRAGGGALGVVPTRPGDDRPGTWFALDKGGATLAVLRARELELWKPGDRTARVASRTEDDSWGPPRFLSTGDLITHHQGAVVVWSGAAGAPIAAVEDPLLTLVRGSYDGPGGSLLVRCSQNRPGPANTMPFTADLPGGKLVDRLGPHRDGVSAAVAFEGGWVTADQDHVYQFGADGAERARFELPGVVSLKVSERGVQFGAAGGVAGVLDLPEARLHRFSTGRTEAVLFTDMGARELVGLDAQGRVFAWSVTGDGEPIAARRNDAAKGRARRAIGRLALSDLEGAEQGLAAVVTAQHALGAKADADTLELALAGHYARSLLAREEASQFVQKLAGGPLDPKSEAVSGAWLLLAEELTHAEALDAGFDLYFTWLKGVHSGVIARTSSTRAVAVGLALDTLVGSVDADELREALLRAMAKVFPEDTSVKERLAELADRGGG